jgi:hypothetical protein
MNQLSVIILVVLVIFVTVIIWNNNAESYKKRGKSDYALLNEFNQHHSISKRVPFNFRLGS